MHFSVKKKGNQLPSHYTGRCPAAPVAPAPLAKTALSEAFYSFDHIIYSDKLETEIFL